MSALQPTKKVLRTFVLGGSILVILLACFFFLLDIQQDDELHSEVELRAQKASEAKSESDSSPVENIAVPPPTLNDNSRPNALNLISSQEDLETLAENQRFTLRTLLSEEERLIELKVISRNENPGYTQIEARGEDGIALIVFTNNTTRAYLKVRGLDYSYAGNDFNGIVPRMKTYPIRDTVRYPEEKSKEIKLKHPVFEILEEKENVSEN